MKNKLLQTLPLRLIVLAIAVLTLMVGPSASAQSVVDTRFGAGQAHFEPQAADDANVGWEVVVFDWSQLQPSASVVLDNSSLDPAIFSDARSAGREIAGLLVNTPDWATEGRPNVGVPEGLYDVSNSSSNLWAAYVRQVVSTYSGSGVKYWIIWDNPNIPSGVYGTGWEGSMRDYYQLLKVAHTVAKQVDPDAQILLAGYSQAYDAQWLNRLLELMADDPQAEAKDYYFDIATLRLYYDTDNVFTSPQLAFFSMQQNGIAKDLWITSASAYPPDIALTEYPEVTPEQQASFVIQSMALGLASGAQRVAIDQFVDTESPDGEIIPGLIGPAGGPRPAYDAFGVVTAYFANEREAFHNPAQFELLRYVRFKHTEKVTHIAWASTAQPAFLSIPARGTQATLVDQTGNEQTITPEDGVYTLRLEGANCNSPGGLCAIGGPVLVLVEDGLDPFNEPPPAAQPSEQPAPDLGPGEATATPQPTATRVPAEQPTAVAGEPTADSAPEVAEAQPTELMVEETEEPAPLPQETAPEPDPAAITPPPTGLRAALPFLLVGLGTLIIGSGLGIWLRDKLNIRIGK